MKRLDLVRNGFVRKPEYDFTDDGSSFKAYEYNGVIVTYTTYRGEYYISIRVDYIEDKHFTYFDYSETEWYKLLDKYNGTDEVDVDDLKHIIDIVKVETDKLEQQVLSEKELDLTDYKNRIKQEIELADETLNRLTNVDITKYNPYDVKQLAEYGQRMKQQKQKLEEKYNDTPTRYEYQTYKKYQYIVIRNEEDFYIKQIAKILDNSEI